MAVTIREVAEKAGVSTAAVSKVLHGSGSSVRVSAARAEHIRQVARDMAYVPNALARSLRSSRTRTVGVLFENLSRISTGPLYTMHLLDGVSKELFKRHYRLTLLAEFDHDNILGSLGDGRLDGVIWCKLVRDEAISQALHDCPIPIVALNAPIPSGPTEAVFISCDNQNGMEAAVDHLWSLGHRRILFLREEQEISAPDCVDRLAGFTAAMERRGVTVEPEDIAAWDWMLREFSEWWAAKPPHTAIIGWSERCAGALLTRCIEAGVNVPNELSVVGFDSTQYCEGTRPRMTAVRQPIAEMASTAARVLLDMLDGKPPETYTHVFPCDFDIRDSTAPPR